MYSSCDTRQTDKKAFTVSLLGILNLMEVKDDLLFSGYCCETRLAKYQLPIEACHLLYIYCLMHLSVG